MTNGVHQGTDPAAAAKTARRQAADWLARVQSGTMTAAERQALARWRQADPSHEAAYRRAESFWSSGELEIALGRERTELETGNNRARPRRRRARTTRTGRGPPWVAS